MRHIVLAAVATFLISLVVVRALWSERLARLVLDVPNERSLHDRPVPRTGGVGIMFAAGLGWMLAGLFGGSMGGAGAGGLTATAITCGLGLMMAALFLVDDVRGLPVGARFLAQFTVAIAFIALTGGHPLWLSPILVLGLVWSMNLYNFMDGSNGMAGGMAVIGFGALAIAAGNSDAADIAALSGITAAAAAGFLVWNTDPARIFLGDAGSIPLGFLAAAIGVLGWQRGVWPFWFPALVFAAFIVDSGLTLAKRLVHGEKPWVPHRSHYYQRLIRMGWSHRRMAMAAYALMLASSASALWLRTAPPEMVLPVLGAWGAALAALALAVDRRWRASPVRGS